MLVAKNMLFELYFERCRPRYVESNPQWQKSLETLDFGQEKLLREEIKAALVAGFYFGAEAALDYLKNRKGDGRCGKW
ncbi:MAG: hypothetical protein AB1426_03650 [Bacillota bacterium]